MNRWSRTLGRQCGRPATFGCQRRGNERFFGVLAAGLLGLALTAGPAAAAPGSDDSTASTSRRGNAVGFTLKWGAVSKQCSFTRPPKSWRGYIEVNWWVEPGTI
jgi:hypothetical protein